ncbi:MAG TPA: BamA/TamA family outer membrane protein [Turneriella sp.]|nr:BamA/TamA family outer membrane protein [Turneriella sp.]HNL10169.1 BamA/TamA family outer membrane protein [Turneriella sp.]
MRRSLRFISQSWIPVTAMVTVVAMGIATHNYVYAQAERFVGKRIRKVDFKGNVNVSRDTIYNDIIQMKIGQTLTLPLINGDIKALFGEGSFAYARIEGEDFEDGVAVTFHLQERPRVKDITFLGLDELSATDVQQAIPLKEDDIYTERKIADSIQRILGKYREKGLFNASIRVRKSEVDPAKNTINITFVVDEGEQIKIAKINLLGVTKADPEDVLAVLELEEDGFIADGTFKNEVFEKDKNSILDFYKNQGFLDVELEDARYDYRWKNPKTQEERVIVITYKIREGDQYFYNGYDLTWDERFLNPTTKKQLFSRDKVEEFFEYTNSDIGSVLDNGKFSRDRGIINYLYSQEGYIYARVQPERTIIPLTKEAIAEKRRAPQQVESEKEGKDYYNLARLERILERSPELQGRKFVHTRFVVSEGDKGFIENIIIKGNKKTLDKVIRRELIIHEGELFNSELVQRSRERVHNLQFFKEVNVDARPGSTEGKMNLVIDVEEQPTGTISLGGGYGTNTGFSIFTEVAENNLNGTGQRISGRVEFGPLRTALEASWTEPWLFDTPWSLTLTGFYVRRRVLSGSINIATNDESATYNLDTVGATIGIGHRLWVNWGHYHRYSPQLSVANGASSMVDDNVFLLVQRGWQVKNTITNGIFYDNRDNIFNTTRGARVEFSHDFVGNILGGQDHFMRYYPQVDFFWWMMDYTFFNLIRKNVLRRWRVVQEIRGSATFTQPTKPFWGTQDIATNPYVEIQDRLYLGGYESLRGWTLFDAFYGDTPAGQTWRNGGSHRILFGSEIRVPVEPSLFWLVLFFDAGALYQNMAEYSFSSTTPAATVNAYSQAQLSQQTFALSYFRYSWGFGFRLQIPILPLRIYLAKRLLWDDNLGWFRDHPNQSGFEFVFGIGDRRF